MGIRMLLKYDEGCIKCRDCAAGNSPLFHLHALEKDSDISNINHIGGMFIYVADGMIEVSAGHSLPDIMPAESMAFVPVGAVLSGKVLTDSSIVTCLFSRDMLPCSSRIFLDIRSADDCGESYRPYLHLKAKPLVAEFFSLLRQGLELGLGCPSYHDIKRKELFMLLVSLYTKYELYHLIYNSPGLRDGFRDFVFRNYKQIPDVKTFAMKANMSISTFQRWFKNEMGRLPGEWLKERRAQLVLHEIENTDKGFSLIAEEFGFSSGSHLGTFCKHHFGKLPSQLRPKRSEWDQMRK